MVTQQSGLARSGHGGFTGMPLNVIVSSVPSVFLQVSTESNITLQSPCFCVTLLGRVNEVSVELIVVNGSASQTTLGLPSTGARHAPSAYGEVEIGS